MKGSGKGESWSDFGAAGGSIVLGTSNSTMIPVQWVTLFRTSAGWPVAFQVGRDAKQELAQPFLFAPAKLHERSNNSDWPIEENFTSCIEIIFL